MCSRKRNEKSFSLENQEIAIEDEPMFISQGRIEILTHFIIFTQTQISL